MVIPAKAESTFFLCWRFKAGGPRIKSGVTTQEASLLARKVHVDDVGAVLAVLLFLLLGALWRVVLRLLMLLGGRFVGAGVEGQRELDCGVVELGDGCERDIKSRRNAAEGEPDGKGVLLDLEVPEAVLDDDRHLVR